MPDPTGPARRSLPGATRFGASDDSPQGLEERPVLAFDCSGPWCRAALIVGGKVIQRDEPMEKGQAERLMPLLDDLLAEAGLGWGDLAAVAVGTGPGNFTGVRIEAGKCQSRMLNSKVPDQALCSRAPL